MKAVKFLAAGLFLVGSVAVAVAAEATDPTVKARQALMDMIAMNTKVLGDMAGGKTAHDAAKAEGAKAALIEASAKIEATFMEQGGADPVSEAKPEIWASWDDFLVKAKALGDAAGTIDVASVESIGAGMGTLGGACKDCHKAYRVTK